LCGIKYRGKEHDCIEELNDKLKKAESELVEAKEKEEKVKKRMEGRVSNDEKTRYLEDFYKTIWSELSKDG